MDRVVRLGSSKKQALNRDLKKNHADILGKVIVGKKTSKCKGSVAETWVMSS